MNENDPDFHWWAFGDYTGDSCPKCGRERLMKCEDLEKRERIICEKCSWEPAKNDWCYEAL